jgi:hypothetical protein
MSAILIVISVILGIFTVNIMFSLLGMPSFWEIDIQMQLLYVILPLSVLIILIMLAMAILLTGKKE